MKDNILIAKFMGLELQPYEKFMGNDQVTFKPENLNYHKSWERLMSVAEKIAGICSKNTLYRERLESEMLEHIRWHSGDLHISVNPELAYESIVEFIKWYNENIKS